MAKQKFNPISSFPGAWHALPQEGKDLLDKERNAGLYGGDPEGKGRPAFYWWFVHQGLVPTAQGGTYPAKPYIKGAMEAINASSLPLRMSAAWYSVA